MKTKKHASPTKNAADPEEHDEAVADKLVDLAGKLRDLDLYATLSEPMRKTQADLRRTLRKCLQQQREQALDEALEHAYEEDIKAYRTLRAEAEEMAGTAVFHRDTGPEFEVNAFVIPFFVQTRGGLREEQCFQDEEAFDKLRASIQAGGLESPRASVALVSYAYHPDELERIGFCQLRAMVQEAHESLTRKKAVSADAIAQSMRGWPGASFGPDDTVVELRFLLGFALKSMEDAFYHVPAKEAAADRYFEARAERFRAWSQEVTPLLARCLVTDGRQAQISFLYQDLFHGGLESALAEQAMLLMLSEVQQALDARGLAAENAAAIIGPAQTDDDAVIRISLQTTGDGADAGMVDRPLRRLETVEAILPDIADGLASIGMRDLRLARRIDSDGTATGVRPYAPR